MDPKVNGQIQTHWSWLVAIYLFLGGVGGGAYTIAAVNSYASPTSAIEAGRVYVHYGTYGTACLDTATGNVLWTLYSGTTGFLQDVLSHMRLFGIALSGSIMALVVNEYGKRVVNWN